MSVELRPLGVMCNIACSYCYQQPQRDAANVSRHYDMARMKEAVSLEGGPFTLFGGEPLLMPLDDLAELVRWGHERYGSSTIQTNGVLVTKEHIDLFRRYNVSVGISVDGPDDLNDVRWHGSLERTRESTTKSIAAIEALCRAGHYPGLIVTIHRGNATAEKLPRLITWVESVLRLGVKNCGLHLLESENPQIRQKWGLTEAENIAALSAFRDLEKRNSRSRFKLFRDMRQLLMGDDQDTSCVWNACDPYTTPAVRGVEGQGQRSNCGRTNKDGVDFVKAGAQGFERYISLYQVPQDSGGCKDCRFFLMCKGQCPGTAIDGDWRNRTEHCGVWMTIFEQLESELVAAGLTPLSLRHDRREVERRALELWSAGKRAPVAELALEA